MGMLLHEIEKSLSVALIRADGLDQAKHRCPRALVHGHAWQRLLRPALHIQKLRPLRAGSFLGLFWCPKDFTGSLNCFIAVFKT